MNYMHSVTVRLVCIYSNHQGSMSYKEYHLHLGMCRLDLLVKPSGELRYFFTWFYRYSLSIAASRFLYLSYLLIS